VAAAGKQRKAGAGGGRVFCFWHNSAAEGNHRIRTEDGLGGVQCCHRAGFAFGNAAYISQWRFVWVRRFINIGRDDGGRGDAELRKQLHTAG